MSHRGDTAAIDADQRPSPLTVCNPFTLP